SRHGVRRRRGIGRLRPTPPLHRTRRSQAARTCAAANTLGWTVGWAILLAGALAGATFGAIQRLVLRRVLPHLDGWVWVSTAGFGMAFTAVWALGGGGHGAVAHHALPHAVDLAGPLGGAMIGAALGASQWLIL